MGPSEFNASADIKDNRKRSHNQIKMIVLFIEINYPQLKYFNSYQNKSYMEFRTRFGIADMYWVSWQGNTGCDVIIDKHPRTAERVPNQVLRS